MSEALANRGTGSLALANMNPAPAPADPLESAISATLRPGGRTRLRRDQKAAVIVRLMHEGRQSLPLKDMDAGNLARLVHATADLRHVSGSDLAEIVGEFIRDVNSNALYFRPGLEMAMRALDDHLDPDVRAILLSGVPANAPEDPWVRIASADAQVLANIFERETPHVCGVILAKLPAAKAAEVLALLSEDIGFAATLAATRANRVEHRRAAEIGLAIAEDIDSQEDTGALSGDPVERVGAILNFAPGTARDALLEKLAKSEPVLTDRMRRSMFTFGDIPERVEPRDVPKIMRQLENATIVTALAGMRKTQEKSVGFILENLSKRLAEQLGEEVEAAGAVKIKDAEDAAAAIVQKIRELETAAEILLRVPED